MTIELADDIKKLLKIEEVIGEYVALKQTKRGHFIGLCPFHNEKTPSMHVDSLKGFFKCFGCHAGGDIITFIQLKLGLGFKDATEHIADKYRITTNRKPKDNRNSFTDLLSAIHLVTTWFHENLVKDSRGYGAMQYILKRNIDSCTIEKFNIGYCPKDTLDILSFAKKHNVNPYTLTKLGVLQYYNDTYHNTFSDRIIFPITNFDNQVCGFGTRVIQANHEPKYLNSKESDIFQKSELLYGLHDSENTGTAYIVEGYTDVISMHTAGFYNAVSPMGTTISSEMIQKLSLKYEYICFCLDSDAAGQKATQKALIKVLEMLTKKTLNTYYFATLPDNTDPDSIAQTYGHEHLKYTVYATTKTLIQTIEHNLLLLSERSQSLEDYVQTLTSHIKDISTKTLLRRKLFYYIRTLQSEETTTGKPTPMTQPMHSPEHRTHLVLSVLLKRLLQIYLTIDYVKTAIPDLADRLLGTSGEFIWQNIPDKQLKCALWQTIGKNTPHDYDTDILSTSEINKLIGSAMVINDEAYIKQSIDVILTLFEQCTHVSEEKQETHNICPLVSKARFKLMELLDDTTKRLDNTNALPIRDR